MDDLLKDIDILLSSFSNQYLYKSICNCLSFEDCLSLICLKTNVTIRFHKKEIKKLLHFVQACKQLYEYGRKQKQNSIYESDLHLLQSFVETYRKNCKNAIEDCLEQIELMIQTHYYDKSSSNQCLQKEQSILDHTTQNEEGTWWVKWLKHLFQTKIKPNLSSYSLETCSTYQFFIYFRDYLTILSEEEQQTLFYITETILGGYSLEHISNNFKNWLLIECQTYLMLDTINITI